MLRRSTSPYTRLTRLLLVLLAVALPVHSARSQDRAMQDRLERLEKDLSMLQRQVYRGGGSPAFAAGASPAVDTEIRMDRLEAEMRDLTGRVENTANGVEQLRRRLEQINTDIDVRFQGQGQSATVSPRSTCTGFRASCGPRTARPISLTLRFASVASQKVPTSFARTAPATRCVCGPRVRGPGIAGVGSRSRRTTTARPRARWNMRTAADRPGR